MLDHAADERGVADRELRQRLHVWARNRESPPVGRTTECPAGQCRMHHAACSACTVQHFARIARIGRCREQSLVRRARPRITSTIVLFAAPFARRHLIKKSASTFSHARTHARTHSHTHLPMHTHTRTTTYARTRTGLTGLCAV